MKLRLNVTATLAAFALLAACSPKGGDAATATNSSPASGAPAASTAGVASGGGAQCGALTAAKASTVLNTMVTLAVDTSGGSGRSNCTYTNSTGAKVRAYVVVGPDAQQQYGATKDGTTQPTDVAGIGDKAFDSDQGFGAIQGDHFVSVIGGIPSDPTTQRDIAKAMLSTLAGG